METKSKRNFCYLENEHIWTAILQPYISKYLLHDIICILKTSF